MEKLSFVIRLAQRSLIAERRRERQTTFHGKQCTSVIEKIMFSKTTHS